MSEGNTAVEGGTQGKMSVNEALGNLAQAASEFRGTKSQHSILDASVQKLAEELNLNKPEVVEPSGG